VTQADWRERKKAATRHAIQQHALRLFLEKGYEATTVEEIAAAAGVSHMTFFRHFPRKEAVVESDDYDPLLAELVAARPAHEDPLTAIHRALRQGLAAILPSDREAILVRTRLVLDTPALRARNWQNQDATRDLFAAVLARRDGITKPDLRIRVLAAAALAAITTAITTWAEGSGATDLVALVDEAFAALDVPTDPSSPERD
jgi:AcrR family transcriptional regulator